MAERVDELFAEYADAYARGERPQAREYLARAAGGGEELARLIDRFVTSVPAPAPTEEELTLTAAWLSGDPPLLELRRRRALKRDQVVDALMRLLGIETAKREKVARYYHELESGLLNVDRVDQSVWDALGQTLQGAVRELAGRRDAYVAAQPAFFRTAEASLDMAAPPSPPPVAEEPDEVDRLFGGPGPS